MPDVILVADDDEVGFFLLKRAFAKTSDARLFHVADGAEAIDYLKGVGPYEDRARFPFPDFVFLDIKMPQVSGFEVLHWIRRQERFPSIFVMMLSASTFAKDVEQALNAGANCYLSKPVDFAGFEQLVA